MRKEYESLRIVSIDGSTILKHSIPSYNLSPMCTLKNGKLDKDKFNGILNESLDTDKLREVYKAHKKELPFPFTEYGIYARALVNVSFKYAVKEYEKFGQRYVKHGYTVSDSDMHDHCYINGGILIAVEEPYENDNDYAPWKILLTGLCSESILIMLMTKRRMSVQRPPFLLLFR